MPDLKTQLAEYVAKLHGRTRPQPKQPDHSDNYRDQGAEQAYKEIAEELEDMLRKA
jgi:hypothetical protein